MEFKHQSLIQVRIPGVGAQWSRIVALGRDSVASPVPADAPRMTISDTGVRVYVARGVELSPFRKAQLFDSPLQKLEIMVRENSTHPTFRSTRLREIEVEIGERTVAAALAGVAPSMRESEESKFQIPGNLRLIMIALRDHGFGSARQVMSLPWRNSPCRGTRRDKEPYRDGN